MIPRAKRSEDSKPRARDNDLRTFEENETSAPSSFRKVLVTNDDNPSCPLYKMRDYGIDANKDTRDVADDVEAHHWTKSAAAGIDG